MRTLALLCAALACISGCTCAQRVNTVAPSVKVTPSGLDFGPVKVGERVSRTLMLESVTQAPVVIEQVSLDGEDAFVFQVSGQPARLEALGRATVTVTYSPRAVRAQLATLVIATNDPERPLLRVALAGEGAAPKLTVTADCATARQCVGSVTATPLSIDFGAEPLVRLLELDPTRLPTVFVTNDGAVALRVAQVAIEGPDAAAFTFAGNAMIPAVGSSVEGGGGFNVAVRFKPTSESQATYRAALRIDSDDPEQPQVMVALSGAVRANLPPVVCANLVRVVPPALGDGPRDYSGAAQWAQLLTAPIDGYDLRATRDVRPGELAVFSALSNSVEASTCSFDPEDGRAQLSFAWAVVDVPPGTRAPPLAGAATSQAQLRPIATGEYTVELTVTDAQQHATTVRLRFAVAFKQDLVAQLQWPGAANVDLDLHLVRPSARPDGGDAFTGVFEPFGAGIAGKTSGDINGYARRTQLGQPGAGLDFDWGSSGTFDDPTLNVDDEGRGPLLENISLNAPENDARCSREPCTYGVFVHSFKDARDPSSAAACVVDGGVGCIDGAPCACPPGSTCVADSAPIADAGRGPGRCLGAPRPVLRLFFRGSARPAHVIPLDTLTPADELMLGAPCQVLHLADITWPARGTALPDGGALMPTVTVPGADVTGRVTNPALARFGWRQPGGSLQCTPDLTGSGLDWYSRQP
jgi:hypothetical protein